MEGGGQGKALRERVKMARLKVYREEEGRREKEGGAYEYGLSRVTRRETGGCADFEGTVVPCSFVPPVLGTVLYPEGLWADRKGTPVRKFRRDPG